MSSELEPIPSLDDLNLHPRGVNVPVNVHLRWDGSLCVNYLPEGQRYGHYSETIEAGTVTPQILDLFSPIIERQRAIYPDEELEGGALVFKVEDGHLILEAISAGLVFREAGGWSYQKPGQLLGRQLETSTDKLPRD